MFKRKDKRLSRVELELISHNERQLKTLLSQLDMARQFKLGDYLVVHGLHEATGKSRIITNSYGVPIKFKVEFVDSNGIAYVRKVINMEQMSKGLFPLFDFSLDGPFEGYTDYFFRGIRMDSLEWKLDEEYVEATIMGEEESYVSSLEHDKKSKAHREISKYNSSIRKRMNSTQVAQRFMNDLKIGETVWKSAISWYCVTNKILKGANGPCTALVVTDKNNKAKKMYVQDFVYKVFYTDRPRSYKELHDPNI